MLLIIVLIVIIIILWLYWMRVVNIGSGRMAKGSLPIIGYTHRVIGSTEKLWRVIEDVSDDSIKKGGVSRLIIAFQTYYVVTDPEELTIIGNNVVLKHFSFDFSMRWLGKGLVTAPTVPWKHHRRLLNPAFAIPVLQGFIQVFNEQARQLADNLAREVGNGPTDLSDYFRINAMKALSLTELGLSKPEETSMMQKYLKAADELLKQFVTRFQRVWLHTDSIYKLTGLMQRENDLIEVLNAISDKVIKQKTSQQVENYSTPLKDEPKTGQKNKAYLDILLELYSNGILSEKEVREEVDTMLVAGTDPMSWTAVYVFGLLGTYPHVQQKVLDEIFEVLGNSERDLTKEDLSKMIYTEAVIKETVRLYPAIAFSLRTVESDLKLKNLSLRAGDHVVMSFYGVNRHTMWGHDANEFRPERWLEANVPMPNAFGGFGIGKRNCIGKTYGVMAIKTILAHVLPRYNLTADYTKLKLKMDFITKPVSGHLVAVTERNQRLDKIRKQA